MKKLIFISILFVSMGYANSNLELIKQEEKIAQKIFQEYILESDTSKSFSKLFKIHKELQVSIKNSEDKNLLRYLDTCLANLKIALKRSPVTLESIAQVHDITKSIEEGSLYLLHHNKRNSVLAIGY